MAEFSHAQRTRSCVCFLNSNDDERELKKLQIDFPFYPVDALMFAQTSLASGKSRELRKRKKMFNSRARALKMVEHKESNENGFFLSSSLSLATSSQQQRRKNSWKIDFPAVSLCSLTLLLCALDPHRWENSKNFQHSKIILGWIVSQCGLFCWWKNENRSVSNPFFSYFNPLLSFSGSNIH